MTTPIATPNPGRRHAAAVRAHLAAGHAIDALVALAEQPALTPPEADLVAGMADTIERLRVDLVSSVVTPRRAA